MNAQPLAGKELYFWHLLLPGILFVAAVLPLHFQQLDLRLADSLFRWEGGQWLRHYWLLDNVIHDAGRALAGGMLAILVSTVIGSYRTAQLRVYRKGLVYLLTVIVFSIVLINIIKEISGIPCPWDLLRYGDTEAFHDVWSGFRFKSGCFPSGHASAGYVWVALYFFARVYFPRLRYRGLAVGLLLGLVFGIGQQFRGAHFLSHDIWTLMICWYVSLFGFLYFFRQQPYHRPRSNA